MQLKLKDATIFFKMGMRWAFHKLNLDEQCKSKSVFQTQEGLHRMERLYFGPIASNGIFHSKGRKDLAGLRGITNINSNILVYGKDNKDHYNNLEAVLKHYTELRIVLKPTKSTFSMTRKWFGRGFHSNGVCADPSKIAKCQISSPNNQQ